LPNIPAGLGPSSCGQSFVSDSAFNDSLFVTTTSPSINIRPSVNQSINKFITCHSTEARATMSLSQTEKECLKSVLGNVNGWSSPTVQWKRVPES